MADNHNNKSKFNKNDNEQASSYHSNPVKIALVVLYERCEEINVTKDKFVAWLNACGIKCGLSTIGKWAAKMKSGSLNEDKTAVTRRERLMTDQQIKIMIGWVLHQNAEPSRSN